MIFLSLVKSPLRQIGALLLHYRKNLT